MFSDVRSCIYIYLSNSFNCWNTTKYNRIFAKKISTCILTIIRIKILPLPTSITFLLFHKIKPRERQPALVMRFDWNYYYSCGPLVRLYCALSRHVVYCWIPVAHFTVAILYLNQIFICNVGSAYRTVPYVIKRRAKMKRRSLGVLTPFHTFYRPWQWRRLQKDARI